MVNGSRRRTQSRRPRKTGGGGRIGGVIWGMFLLAGIFAFYQIPANPTVPGIWSTLVAKSQWMDRWVHDLVDGGQSAVDSATNGGTGDAGGTGPKTTDANINAADSKLKTLDTAPAKSVDYSRSEWRQWDNVTRCWTVREQVLATQAVQDKTLTLLDKNKQRTTNLSNACYITGGTWVDPYTKETFTNPEDLDIDHLVPLGYVAAHGGQSWSSSKKEDYANDYKESGHLLAVSASANRSKSDSGPADWKPQNKAFWCSYAIDWINVSDSWKLSVTKADKAALTTMLSTCKP